MEAAEETTVVISTHDHGEIESFITHIAYLNSGRLKSAEKMTGFFGRFREVVETFDETARQQIRITHDDQAGAYSDASLIDGRLHCWFAAWGWNSASGGV